MVATTKEKKNKGAEEPARLTLQTVKGILSQDVFKNPTWKGITYFIRDSILFSAIFYTLWNTNTWYYVLPLWIVAGFIISGLFIIGHDAAHGALFKNSRLGWWIGQISMLPSLHAYSQWEYGHNRVHHGHTIKWGADYVWHPKTPEEYKNMSGMAKMMHKLYWSPVGGGIYYLIEIWLKGMIFFTAPSPGAARDKNIIIVFGLALNAAIIWFGGQTPEGFNAAQAGWMWFKVFFMPFLLWNYCIGVTVYVHHISDRIDWKKDKAWSPFHGQVLGTANYHIPFITNIFFHHIFVHMPHHVHMKIPFYNLEMALAEIKKVYGEYVIERKSIVSDYLHATNRCKLYDISANKWLKYSDVA